MTFERIAGLFKRGNRGDKEETPDAPASDPSANATRHALPVGDPDRTISRELAGTLDHGFAQVAGAMDRLNQHLRQNGELMTSIQDTHSQLPALVQAQQKIAGLVANAERGNQAVVQTLSSYLKQRDEAQQAMVRLLGQLNTSVIDQRQAHQDQIRLVMRLQGSNRRILLGLLLVFMLCALVLFALVLVLAIRPELIRNLDPTARTAAREPAAAPASAPAVERVVEPPPPKPSPAVAPSADASRPSASEPPRALPPPVDLRVDQIVR